jgi:hypothetical protein
MMMTTTRLTTTTLLLLALPLAGCGGSTVAPSTLPVPAGGTSADAGSLPAAGGDGAQGGAPSAALGPIYVSFGPIAVAPDCLLAENLPDVVEWHLENVPVDGHIAKAYGHGFEPGCGATTDRLVTDNDRLRWFRDPLVPTRLIVRFDKRTFDDCRAQVDLDVAGANVLGQVINYGRPCEPVDPPTPPVPPEPPTPPVPPEPPTPPVPPVPPVPPPSNVCVARGPLATVHGTAQNGAFEFTVHEGYTLTLSLVAFKFPNLIDWLPQTFVRRHVETFPAGHYERSIEPAWPWRQEDLVCGEYPEGQDLTVENFDYWHERTIAGDASRCETCNAFRHGSLFR